MHPIYARQGIGRALIAEAAAWARAHDLTSLTLTNYVDVPWNGPYYERTGFRYLTPEDKTSVTKRYAVMTTHRVSTRGRALR